MLINSTDSPSVRASIMSLSAASSNTAWTSQGVNVPRNTRDGSTENSAVPNAVIDVLEVLGSVIPDVARFWLDRDKAEGRRRLLESLMLELTSSNLSTCAYWLLVRLGKKHKYCKSRCFAWLINVQN